MQVEKQASTFHTSHTAHRYDVDYGDAEDASEMLLTVISLSSLTSE